MSRKIRKQNQANKAILTNQYKGFDINQKSIKSDAILISSRKTSNSAMALTEKDTLRYFKKDIARSLIIGAFILVIMVISYFIFH